MNPLQVIRVAIVRARGPVEQFQELRQRHDVRRARWLNPSHRLAATLHEEFLPSVPHSTQDIGQSAC